MQLQDQLALAHNVASEVKRRVVSTGLEDAAIKQPSICRTFSERMLLRPTQKRAPHQREVVGTVAVVT